MTHSTTRSARQPRPVQTEETAAFWEGADAGRLVLRRCDSCERLVAPLSPRCPDCLGDSLTPQDCSGRVTLTGHTVLHIPGYPDQAVPTTLVQCAVEEEPRVSLVAFDPDGVTESLTPGEALRIEFRADADGTPLAYVAKGDAQ